MFWGLELGVNERTTYRSVKQFHVSQVAMDIKNTNQDDSEGLTQLWIRKNSTNILLATMSRGFPQWRLDLVFGANERIKFSTNGPNKVFLSGYFIPVEFTDDTEVEMNEQQQADPNEEQNGQVEIQTETLDEGVVITDVKKGKGKKAKLGDNVEISYVNRLQANDIVVGTSNDQETYQINLGSAGINGWNIGIVGMKKGGKRHILCPPNVAYGENGVPPFIPANSTITSTVELLKILDK